MKDMRDNSIRAAIVQLQQEKARIDNALDVLMRIVGTVEKPQKPKEPWPLNKPMASNEQPTVMRKVIHRKRRHGGVKVGCVIDGCTTKFLSYGRVPRKYCDAHRKAKQREWREKWERENRPRQPSVGT